jgi:hypothetical protein
MQGFLEVGPCSPSSEKRTAKDTKIAKILFFLCGLTCTACRRKCSELGGSKVLSDINLRKPWQPGAAGVGYNCFMTYIAAIDMGGINIWVAGYEPDHTQPSAYQRVRLLARIEMA